MVSIMVENLLEQDITESNQDNECRTFIEACRNIADNYVIRVLNGKVRFPYKGDMTRLSQLLCEFQCKNYQVEQMSFEEEILRDYERWS